jgi:hypothetical protein
MNSGEMWEDPTPREGGKAERSESEGGGVAKARGHNASKFRRCTLATFMIFGSGGGRGGREEEGTLGGDGLRWKP